MLIIKQAAVKPAEDVCVLIKDEAQINITGPCMLMPCLCYKNNWE